MGLYGKYYVSKVDGETDPNAEYFVLRMDRREKAEMAALRAFAYQCDDEQLSADLLHYAGEPDNDNFGLCGLCGSVANSIPQSLIRIFIYFFVE